MSTSVKNYIAPSPYPGGCEFKIPMTQGTIKNPVLYNFGIKSYQAAGPVYYPRTAGAASLLESIRLTLGRDGQVISELNSNLADLYAYEILSDGYADACSMKSDGTSFNPDISYDEATKTNAIAYHPDNLADQNVNHLVSLDLKKLCPFFYGLNIESYMRAISDKRMTHKKLRKAIKQLPGLPGNLELTIQITYSSQTADRLFIGGNAADDWQSFLNKDPYLTYDLDDQAKVPESYEIVYDSYTVETYPALPKGSHMESKTQSTSLKNGIGKTVRSLIFINKPNDSDAYRLGVKSFSSVALRDESVDISVNGIAMLPADCIRDAYDKALVHAMNKPNFCSVPNGITAWTGSTPYDGNSLKGNLSYLQVDVPLELQMIRSLSVTHSWVDYLTTPVVANADQALLGDFSHLVFYVTKNVLSYKDGTISITQM